VSEEPRSWGKLVVMRKSCCRHRYVCTSDSRQHYYYFWLWLMLLRPAGGWLPWRVGCITPPVVAHDSQGGHK
jgi:hypothetical protein